MVLIDSHKFIQPQVHSQTTDDFLCIGSPTFHSYRYISKNCVFTCIKRCPRKGFWAKQRLGYWLSSESVQMKQKLLQDLASTTQVIHTLAQNLNGWWQKNKPSFGLDEQQNSGKSSKLKLILLTYMYFTCVSMVTTTTSPEILTNPKFFFHFSKILSNF